MVSPCWVPGHQQSQWGPSSGPGYIRARVWGLLSQFPPFRYFPNFSASPKCKLPIDYHIYFWQVSPQLSCGDTCQIWMWYRESNWYFCKIEKFAYGEINERSFGNPQPCTSSWRIEFPHRYRNFMKKKIGMTFLSVMSVATKLYPAQLSLHKQNSQRSLF